MDTRAEIKEIVADPAGTKKQRLASKGLDIWYIHLSLRYFTKRISTHFKYYFRLYSQRTHTDTLSVIESTQRGSQEFP